MAKDRIDRTELADKLVESAQSAEDPLRRMAEMIADFVMEAEVTAKLGAEPHERTEQRTGHRNGHRDRRWDTRLGTLHLSVPKLREGGYVPSFIEHRKRSEQALISVIQEAVVQGVSTRKIEVVLERPSFTADASASLELALSAVIEQRDGGLSYWALRHAPGQPDFHHPDGFALTLRPDAPGCSAITRI